MNPITVTAKVMQNNTVCLAGPIRERLGVKPGDKVILSMDESGVVRVLKAPTSLEDLVGIGKETFEALGGGEAFLKAEREQWGA